MEVIKPTSQWIRGIHLYLVWLPGLRAKAAQLLSGKRLLEVPWGIMATASPSLGGAAFKPRLHHLGLTRATTTTVSWAWPGHSPWYSSGLYLQADLHVVRCYMIQAKQDIGVLAWKWGCWFGQKSPSIQRVDVLMNCLGQKANCTSVSRFSKKMLGLFLINRVFMSLLLRTYLIAFLGVHREEEVGILAVWLNTSFQDLIGKNNLFPCTVLESWLSYYWYASR